MTIAFINGANLNLLGRREPHIYGSDTLLDIELRLRDALERDGHRLHFFQSNVEGAIIDELHRLRYDVGVDGIVINPGAYTHTSIAIRDAISAIGIPVVEVHLSNIHARETFRERSMVAGVCVGRIEGLGWMGYLLAAHYLASRDVPREDA